MDGGKEIRNEEELLSTHEVSWESEGVERETHPETRQETHPETEETDLYLYTIIHFQEDADGEEIETVESPESVDDAECGTTDLQCEPMSQSEAEVTPDQDTPTNMEVPPPVQFHCADCDFNTIRSEMEGHIKDQDHSYGCGGCAFKSKWNRSWRKHMQRKHGMVKRSVYHQLMYQCGECGYTTKARKAINMHIRKHSGERPFKCSYCNYAAKDKSTLRRHSKCHTGSGQFTCEICNFSTSQKTTLGKHMKIHNVGDRYPCMFCHYVARVESDLAIHIRESHPPSIYQCPHCAYSTALLANFSRHMRKHTGVKPFKCDICNYATAVQSNLVRHKRTHTNEKPFMCKECSYATSVQSNLVRHVNTQHMNVMLYHCNHCGYSSNFRGNMIRHLSAQHSKKVFKEADSSTETVSSSVEGGNTGEEVAGPSTSEQQYTYVQVEASGTVGYPGNSTATSRFIGEEEGERVHVVHLQDGQDTGHIESVETEASDAGAEESQGDLQVIQTEDGHLLAVDPSFVQDIADGKQVHILVRDPASHNAQGMEQEEEDTISDDDGKTNSLSDKTVSAEIETTQESLS
ncbi:ZNF407 [Branchiostoma lanceolatum]|uniref:ZNF407 protein n=1 Tax=Branchiostoma lanceolatum TaxID=7740 RepID=A0A8J9Z2Q1_BRALA|nr:ZNF407 [Branchiostoma lanceolatum]